MVKRILVTGGAGFIGSNFIAHWLGHESSEVVNLDKMTYAGNASNLAPIERACRHVFIKGDINDQPLIAQLLETYKPWAVINFAAETHVDRSIQGAEDFIETNVRGTFGLLEAVRRHWSILNHAERSQFRFVQVSTDEVYGSLSPEAPGFSESAPYEPNNPYAASKASADLLVRAFHHTYDIPTLTTRCSNNYGPHQYPEKLIPLTIHNAVSGIPIPVYGDGRNIRDWLYVTDHCEAIRLVVNRGKAGETYNIGGENEKTNIAVVTAICSLLAELRPGAAYQSLIRFVPDRPGHDRRYSMSIEKIRRDLGWSPAESFSTGLRKTVQWYLNNKDWGKESQDRQTLTKAHSEASGRRREQLMI